MDNEKTLDKLADFHGHLGPYVVVGYKMGEFSNDELTSDPFEKDAFAKTGAEPPISCVVDGIQFSSGCTLGKGNIRIEDGKKPEAVFSTQNGKLKLSLKKRIQEKIEDTLEDELEEISESIFEMNPEELFEIEKS